MHLLLGESDEPGIYWASSGGPRSLAGYPRVRHPVTDHVALRLSAAVGGGGRGAAGSARPFPTDPPVAPGLALGRACGRRSKAGQAPPRQGRPSQGGRARVRMPGCGTAIREPLRRGAPSRNSPPGRKPDSRYRPNGRSARHTPLGLVGDLLRSRHDIDSLSRSHYLRSHRERSFQGPGMLRGRQCAEPRCPCLPA